MRLVASGGEPPRILLVGSSADEAMHFERLLATWESGCVTTTTESADVVGLCAEVEPDLIVLDLDVRQPAGAEVLALLRPWRAGRSPVPVLALTSDVRIEATRAALATGATDVVLKPFDDEEARLRVAQLLDTHRMQDDLRRHAELVEQRVREGADELQDARRQIAELSAAPPVLPSVDAPAGRAPARTAALADAAAALGVSLSTVRRWADSGRVPSERTAGGHRRFAVSEMRAAIGSGAVGTRPTVRRITPPTHPLPAVADILASEGPQLVRLTADVLYSGRPGWWTTQEALAHSDLWIAAVARSLDSGDYDIAIGATRRLMDHADQAGAPRLEHHRFLERFSDNLIGRMGRGGAFAHTELLSLRRLLGSLRQTLLEGEPRRVRASPVTPARTPPPAPAPGTDPPPHARAT